MLDLHTLLFCGATPRFAFALLFAMLWSRNRASWYYLFWAIAEFLWGTTLAGAFLEPTALPSLGNMPWSAIAAAACVLTWVGLLHFDVETWPRSSHEILGGAVAAALWGLVVPWVSPGTAVLPSYLSDSVICLLAAVVLVRRREPAPLPAHVAFSLVFGVFGTALLLAAIAAVVVPLLPGHRATPSAALLGEIPLAIDQIAGCLVFVALLAMTGERALNRLESEALHDPQTGLLNRRGLETSLSRMLALAHRSNSPVSLLLADIDHFKSINDRYGHHMGDVALQLVVTTARRVLKRQSDFAARFGGDEFAILLLDTDLAGARMVAEKLRKAVAEQPIAVGENSIDITLSIGVSLVPSSEPDLIAALARADQGLYLAKSRGRNQVAEVAAQPEAAAAG